jgi:hypothetical protein
MTTAIETQRNADFKACPILSDYIATMLSDLQFREMDEACTDDREERDTGTIYTLNDSLYAKCKADCEAFMADNATAIEEALALVPGEEGLRYGRDYMTYDRIGYYFYMSRVGHGVGFTDDAVPGESECLAALEKAARDAAHFEPYLGDDGEVYA